MVSIGQGTPPPIWGAKSAFTPIIFRTENTEKSRLGLIGKNFGKFLRGNVSGKRKPPILAEIEGEVLIMKKDVLVYSDAKVVELF